MAITTQGLIKLGFTPETDFVLQDDGAGAHIKEWKSGSPQPTESEIETAHATAQTEFDAKAYARARSSAYPTNADFMEAYTEKEIGGNTSKWDEYVIKYKVSHECCKESKPKITKIKSNKSLTYIAVMSFGYKTL